MSTEDEEPEDTGRTRLWTALRRPSGRGQVAVAVLLAVLGFGAVVQVHSNGQNDTYAGMRQDDLISLLNSLSAGSQRAEQQIAQLQQTRNSLRSSTDNRKAALEQARQQADELGILAGTKPAVGPGIRVTIDDPHVSVGTDQLLNGLEELRDAGAEAIEINDTVRVVAQTAVTDSDSGVVVDGQQLTPPYVIDAIGDAHTLAGGLDIPKGFVDDVQRSGATVVIDKIGSVEIATTRQPSPPEYAKPAQGQ